MPQQPDRPIRVLLDISLLGRVHAAPPRSSLRTGIYRVVEQTVRSVAAEPDVRLTLGAHAEGDAAIAYAGAHPEFSRLRIRVAARKRLESRLFAELAARHARVGAFTPGALPLRAVRKALAVTNHALDGLTANGVRGAGADVFHSPFSPLPPPERRVRRVRYVLTVYDIIPLLFPETVASWGGDRWMRDIVDSIRPEDHVLTISEHSRRDLLNLRRDLAPERVHVTPLAADPERFYPCEDAARVAAARARYGVPDAPYVMALGTLAPHKNIPHLIRAFADLVRAERLDDLHLVLTGAKGWGYDPIFETLGELGDTKDRVVFTGFVDDADLAPLYTGALVFVYPSLYEGFGLPPLEAMQCGTPVITSNTSSFPEVVGDGGVLVDPRDGAALAQAILDVYRDPARRAELAARARARAREFTWQRFGRRTVDAYRAAL